MIEQKPQDRRTHHSWGEHSHLLQSVDCARSVHLLNATEADLLELLCKNIEFGLDEPYSVLPVDDAAYSLGVSPETIRRTRHSLERKRFLRSDMPANGHRGRFRNKVNGLNLSVLLDRHDELMCRRASKHEDMKAFRALKCEISSLRGRITSALRDGCQLTAEASVRWAKLPRRITTRCMETLAALLEACRHVLAGVEAHPTELCDATHTDTGQFTDTHNKPISSKYNTAIDQERENPDAIKKRNTLLEAVGALEDATNLYPDLAENAEFYQNGYANPLVATVEFAGEMAKSVGVPHQAVEAAKNRVDVGDFIGMCVLVWSRCGANGTVPKFDLIHKPTNWFWSMGAKSQRGEAHVLRSLVGLRKRFAAAT